MLLLKKTISAQWRYLHEAMMAPVSPRNLRLSAILIGIYQLLVAHVLLFLILMGLAHAEQMKAMLAIDIEDQKDNGFYNLSPFRNQLRLRTASQLASITEILLYFLTALAAIYLLSTMALFFGIMKNRNEFILPWLIMEVIFIVSTAFLVVWLQDENIVQIIGGKVCYFTFSTIFVLFDCLKWYIIHSYYQSLRTMDKMREIATVAIPCPPPGATGFNFRRENMYAGTNGYKHILTDSPDGAY